ncbi:YccS family putative transporter [Testudinibacter sp. TR-2022]|uniref:YccS family putative transporter n=1 Tax=Testudinibacter sp. TR-2022 TaxID=2585029 RepID=UPI0011185B88|nr:YccS family putative transporter [Testudinibacter sp. TR-2022]TNH06356.1 TIGR01666 family membrane protein [Pasteurellaceae bacterium Phil11]TNH22237.1 TIGR01666 family membrane protein [Testudinibacter sp. TR-2022]TNH25836.1 TIGR01666 family membrane protein [Testudinibacter sp. TR-2022]
MNKIHWLNSHLIAVIPVFIAVNLAAMLVYSLNISAVAMPFVLGIIAAGLVDLDHGLSGKIKNILITIVAFTISAFGAQISLNNPLYFALMMTLFTFVFTMMGALGQRYSTIAFGTLIVALYTSLTYLPQTQWYINPVMIVCGTLLYSVSSVLTYLFFPRYKVDEYLANAYLALADYLDGKSKFFDPDEAESAEQLQLELSGLNSRVIDAFNLCRQSLFYRLGGQHRHSKTSRLIRYYYAAQDIHERASSSHFDYRKLVKKLQNSDLIFRIQRLLELQADDCRDIAQAILQRKAYQPKQRLQRAAAGIDASFSYFIEHSPNSSQLENLRTVIGNLKSILWQLLFLGKESNEIQDSFSRIITTNRIRGLREIAAAIHSHLTLQSPLFRHAVRLSLVVLGCCIIANALALERGYWVLLTAIFVCQPNYSATKKRLRERILGTLVGVFLGSLLPYFMATLEAKLGLLVITSTLFFYFKNKNYSFSTCFITIQVLICFDISGFDIYGAMWPRVIDTLIGAALAWWAVSYLWPDWKYMKIGKIIHRSIQNNARYLLYIMAQLQFGEKNHVNYRIVRLAAHESAAELNTLIGNMNSEPQKYQRYLSNGFQLLKQNYCLLGYISALGAFRHSMGKHGDDKYFLTALYPAAREFIAILQQLDHLPQAQFDQKMMNISERLGAETDEHFSSPSQLQQDRVLRQQLNMMTQLLPGLYQTVHKQLKLEQSMQD